MINIGNQRAITFVKWKLHQSLQKWDNLDLRLMVDIGNNYYTDHHDDYTGNNFGGDEINSIDTGGGLDDVNCDNVGTCYDGEQDDSDSVHHYHFSVGSLQGYPDCCERWNQQTLQWKNLCSWQVTNQTTTKAFVRNIHK